MRRRPLPAAWRGRLPGLALWLILCVPLVATFDAPHALQRWATLAGFPLLGLAVLVRRRWPLAAVAIPVVPSLVVSEQLATGAYSLALALLGYLAGVRMARAQPALWCFAGVAAAGVPLCALVSRTLWPWFTLLVALLLNVVLPWLLGRYRRQYAELVRTGWRLADRMEREQRAVADRTRLRERARIAGDMHDSLGHDLALIALRAGALEVDPALDADRRAAAGALREAAGTATERLQEIIGVLRTDDEGAPPAPSTVSVSALARRARESGMTVTVERVGDDDAPEPPAMTGHALHRVVQEALTNAAKHAPGAAVGIRTVRSAERATVTVTVTNGPRPVTRGPRPDGSARDPVSGGSGLVGLDERVRLAGGTLRSGPTPEGGFAVTARLPLTGGPAPGAPAPPEPTAAERELAQAQRRVRRRLWQTVALPSAALVALFVLMGVFALVSPGWTVLDRAAFRSLRIGMPRAQVESVVPFFALDTPPDGTPKPPRGWSCTYYGVDVETTSAYELCFAGGRLVRADTVHRRDTP
ncbi:sensor histidine kinase [Streptomyces sp. NPDC101227]|uniref:sensor histidine kinase n=1 Tax=Streptomyces sp. NPDC101227 TaxID=3366136 RepID=UPI0038230E4D